MLRSLKYGENLTASQSLLFVGALILFYSLLFFGYYEREIAAFPPESYDQTAYLFQAYQLEDGILKNGLIEIWRYLRDSAEPQGLLFPVEGSVLSLLFGGGRFGALLLNLFVFIGLEIALYQTVRWVTGERGLGVATAALFASGAVLWMDPGGPFDFRMDFFACAFYGIWVCAVLRSNVFADRRWTLLATTVALFLILNRYIAMVYIGLPMAVLFSIFLFAYFVHRDLENRHRAFNLLLSGSLIVAIMVPIFTWHWQAVWSYYGVGHITGREKYIRAAELGIHDLMGHLRWYVRNVSKDMLGKSYLISGCLLVAGAAISSRVAKSNRDASATISRGIEFLLVVCLTLYVVLTAAISKSPVVGSIFVVPLTLLVVLLTARFVGSKLLLGPTAVVVLAAATANVLHATAPTAMRYGPREERVQWSELATFMQTDASSRGFVQPKLFVDTISGRLLGAAFTDYWYEKTGVRSIFVQAVPPGIEAVPGDWILTQLKDSDYVILTGNSTESVYPFIGSIAPLRPQIREWATANMDHVRTFPFSGFKVDVFRVPRPTIAGISGGWLTSEGVSVSGGAGDLVARPVIRMIGMVGPSTLPSKGSTVPLDAIIRSGAKSRAIKSVMTFKNGTYEIIIDTNGAIADLNGDVEIALSFGRYFVPKEEGMNSDTRRLVVLAPDRVSLLRNVPG